MMNSKKWSAVFVSLTALVLAGIMALNYFVDPYKYFSSQSGEYYEADETDYLREQKAEHIRKCKDNYDAYLVCGSKGGAVRTDKLRELDGYEYYNCWVLSGNLVDYLAYVQYILDHTEAKKILLQLSTSELHDFSREDQGDIYEIPAIVSGESKVAEYMKFLMMNPSVAWEKITGEQPVKYPCLPTGERNLTKYYQYYHSNASAENNNYVNYVLRDTAKYLKYMDRDVPEKPVTLEQIVMTLKEIKRLCDKKGVELQVFYAPLFVVQMMRYEGESFYDMLEESVMIFDEVWCFNNFNGYTLCPYNFYNSTHFFYEMGDLVIDTMKGRETASSDFGVRLTRENVGAEIIKRRQKLAELKSYYLKNHTFPYEGFSSPYNLKKIYG